MGSSSGTPLLLVEPDEPFHIYRDAGVVLTARGETKPEASAFVEYLKSPTAAATFAKWGWKRR